ncbi:hypothetical protein ACFSVK_01750 [Azorhizophilus paspali]|uniref:hypothetical protein n=1 Tax=Azorhizophilus paspali TaxID=69963 RepID=UPI00362C5497
MLLTVAFFGGGEALALVYAVGQSVRMVLSLVFLLDKRQRSLGAVIRRRSQLLHARHRGRLEVPELEGAARTAAT